MRPPLRWQLVVGGVLLALALISQPVGALCGNCAAPFGGEILGCYASSSSNNYCITVRCQAEGTRIGRTQPAYCCFDDMACSI